MPVLGTILRVSVSLLDILLKQWYTSPACLSHTTRRPYATASSESSIHREATNIAVLGGGITGLASAYYLSRSLPNAKVTLFEASSRLGGWLHSQQVDVGTGKIVFEQGPRNIRPTNPNGMVTLDLVRDLGLEDRLLMTPKNSEAAQNRFIYYPDHLVRMPGPGMSFLSNMNTLLFEPIFKGAIFGAFLDSMEARPKRPNDVKDESVGDFITRRFGSAFADNVVSAVFHGIYAGDIYKLSARTILPKQWEAERKHGSIIGGIFNGAVTGRQLVADDDMGIMKEFNSRPATSNKLEEAKKSSVFTFKGGIGELAARLEAKLIEDPKVVIQKEKDILRVVLQPKGMDSKIRIITQDILDRAICDHDFTHAISTISGTRLASLVRRFEGVGRHASMRDLKPLSRTPSVTVMVVNLFFSNPSILPLHGFGYLLPRTVPLRQNFERALGVVFDSDACIGQDEVPGTKVTVMLGGHWWDGWETYPDEDEGASMAKTILKRHLGIDEEPLAIRVSLQRNCIPQYPVGHEKNMEDVSRQLEKYQGRLRVAGNSYTGVGLNDCVRAARDVVTSLVDGTIKTGLESFIGGKKYSWVDAKELKGDRKD